MAERLTFFLHESVAKARIRRLFDVIVEFPDSKPALEDLKQCMEKVSQTEFENVRSLTMINIINYLGHDAQDSWNNIPS